jgi:hypothetical protein
MKLMETANPRATVATTLRVSPEIWLALRRLSEERAGRVGGRPNVSATVADLVAQAIAAKAPEGPADGSRAG